MRRTVTLPAGGDLVVGGLAAAAVGAVACGALAAGDTTSGPVLCPFRLATGMPCPFCGVTRGLAAMGDGRLGLAFEFSPLTFLVLPLALVLVAVVARATVRRERVGWPRQALWVSVAPILGSWLFQLLRGAS